MGPFHKRHSLGAGKVPTGMSLKMAACKPERDHEREGGPARHGQLVGTTGSDDGRGVNPQPAVWLLQ